MRVIFKHEDEREDGTPIGPVTIIENEEPGEPGFTLGRPYDENERDEWKTLAEAEQIAAENGVELEET